MIDKMAMIKQVFIEEAQEIIENINSNIFEFEENLDNKEILNTIFRGIHTLKGSANSVGFTRLGNYVHHFEDLLDFCRKDDAKVNKSDTNLFLDAIGVVSQMLDIEIKKENHLPKLYESTLEKIKKEVSNKNSNTNKNETVNVNDDKNISDIDLGLEFGNDLITEDLDNKNLFTFFSQIKDDEKLFEIILKFGNDAFSRGVDHMTFFNQLNTLGRILHSNWSNSNIPSIENIDIKKNYINNIKLYFASNASKEAIEKLFKPVKEDEYSITLLTKNIQTQKSTTKLQPLQIKVEEKKQLNATSNNTKSIQKKKIKIRSFVKIDTEKLDELFDSIGELVIAQNFLTENRAIAQLQNIYLNKHLEALVKITRRIQSRIMGLRMVPIRAIFDKMKRVLREASRKVNKDVKLTLVGEDTEIDKTMIDKLADPLIHIIRNSMDHGIEISEAKRIAVGKPAQGEIILKAYHQGGNVVIEVIDDGKGIDPKIIEKKAIEKGFITQADAQTLSKKQILQFIMRAGFSTVDVITDLSGRGVGMDVVSDFISNIRGSIEIDSQIGKKTSIKILLPLTLAIIDGMLVKSAKEIFIIPTLSITKSFRPLASKIHTAQTKGEFVELRDEVLPIVRLNKVLNLSSDCPNPSECILICIDCKKKEYAILVDEILGRQQVVIKSIGKAVSKIKEISGGAVLGNGEIALILDMEELYKI